MATTFYLRNGGAGVSGYNAAQDTRGSSVSTGVVNTTASGTEIQWTQTAGGAALSFATKPFSTPVTISAVPTVNVWGTESGGAANCGMRFKLFKLEPGGTKTLFGTLDAGVELTIGNAVYAPTAGSITSTSFARGDRLVMEPYIYNVGTMGGSQTCTISFDRGTAGGNGDSYFTFAETILTQWPAMVS